MIHGDDAKSSFPAKEGLIDASMSFDDDGRVRLGVQADARASLSGAPQALPLPVAELGPLAGGKAARTTWEVLASSVSR